MNTRGIEHRRIGWRFWIYWMLATFAAGLLFLVVSIPLNLAMAANPVPRSAPPSSAVDTAIFVGVMVLSNALLGACLGLTQWLVLKSALAGMRMWIAATTVGFAIGAFFMLVDIPQLNAVGPVTAVLQFGIVPAIFQWLALRGHVYQAGWWILATIVGWPIAFGLTGLAEIMGIYVEPLDLVAALLVPAATEGAGMVWLLRRTAR